MAGQYGADYFFVKDIKKNDVAAKYLKDKNGQYVIDPLTQAPYIVPADYDPAVVIARFSNWNVSTVNSSWGNAAENLTRPFIYAYFAAN